MFVATVAITAMALASPALAQTNKSNEGIQSPTQQQRLDNGTVIPHGATGSDQVHEGVDKSGPATQGRAAGPEIRRNNENQGRDPDPRVRQELQRDPPKGGH
jgi:hypothetical protein